jgi:hypothetical protein
MNIRYIKYIYISFILIFLSTKVFTQNVINILVDSIDTVNKDKYEKAYKNMEEVYLNDREDSNNEIKFIIPKTLISRSTSNGYIEYLKYILKQLEDPSIDMFILSDRFLFSDTGNIESGELSDALEKKRQFHKNYLDFKDYSNFNEKGLNNYFQDILDGCIHEDHVYGLPFEIDYDVLYYKSNGNKTLDSNLKILSWESLEDGTIFNGETVDAGKKYMSIGLMEEDELLNFFVEYINSISNYEEKKTYEKLYNDNTIIDNFSKLVTKIGLNVDLDAAYKAFINNNSLLFKGKMSYYSTLKEIDDSVKFTLLPDNKSILHKKYIVINKNSLKDKDLLYRTAYYLHNESMQQQRFDLYKMVPPSIDFMTSNDPQYDEYSRFYKTMDKINIKKVFADDNSAPFMEIEYLLPGVLKDLVNHKQDFNYVQNVFENIKKVLKDKRNVKQLPIYVIYIPAVIFFISSIVVIFLIIKYKEHPYLKIYSPNFCVLIILGLSINMVFSSTAIVSVEQEYCKYSYLIATITTDLLLFPMVAVTYRIYKILTNTSKISVAKNLNRNITICFILGLSAMITYSYYVGFHVLDFFLISIGNIKFYRLPECHYSSDYVILEFIERRINEIVYIILVYMVIKTAKVSKKFGEFKYVYMMLITGLSEYATSYLKRYVPHESYYYYFIGMISFNVFMDGIFIYYLIGSRLIYVLTHPEENKKKSAKVFKNGYFDTIPGNETTTYEDGGNHSHFIDISKTNDESLCDSTKKYKNNNNKFNLSSNTTISEFDCRYDSNNNIFNQGFNSYNNFGKNQLSSNTTPYNSDYYNGSSSAYFLNQDTYSSQKTVGTQDSQFNNDNNNANHDNNNNNDNDNDNENDNNNNDDNLNLINANSTLPNVSIQDITSNPQVYQIYQPSFSFRNMSFSNNNSLNNSNYINLTNLSMKNNIGTNDNATINDSNSVDEHKK